MRTEPVALGAKLASNETGLSSSALRPLARSGLGMDLFGTGPARRALLALDRLDLQVLDRVVLEHEGDQPVVEVLGGIVTHPLERLGESRHLDQPRHVAPGPHVELYVGQLHSEALV